MNKALIQRGARRQVLARLAFVAALCVLVVWGVFGPSGLLAWRENALRLEQHRAQIERLEARQRQLANRVRLLDPAAVDQDLASELVRRELQVAHPDEYVIDLPMEP